jgi:hypothetical protein
VAGSWGGSTSAQWSFNGDWLRYAKRDRREDDVVSVS